MVYPPAAHDLRKGDEHGYTPDGVWQSFTFTYVAKYLLLRPAIIGFENRSVEQADLTFIHN